MEIVVGGLSGPRKTGQTLYHRKLNLGEPVVTEEFGGSLCDRHNEGSDGMVDRQADLCGGA